MPLTRQFTCIFIGLLLLSGGRTFAQEVSGSEAKLARGVELIKQGSYDEAFDLLVANAAVAGDLKGDFLLKAGLALWYGKKYEEAISYFEAAWEEARTTGDDKLLTQALINLGAVYTSRSKLAEGLFHFKEALTAARRLGDEALLAVINFNLAHSYKESALYDQSIKHLYSAIESFEKSADRKNLAKAYQTLGNVYRELGNDSLSVVYHQKGLDINKDLGDKKVISSNMNDLANTYRSLYDHQRALKYYQQSLIVGDSSYQSTTLGNIAEVYLMMKDYDKAEKYFHQALALRKGEGDDKALADILTDMGGLYREKGELQKSRKILTEGLQLAEAGDFKDVALTNLELQQKLLEDQGDLVSAYHLLRKSIELKEQIFNENKQKVIEQMTIAFEVKDLEKQNALLSEESKLNKALAENEKANRQTLVLALILALLVISVIGYIYYQSRKYARWQNAKRQEIQHRTKNFLQTLTNLFKFQVNNVTDPDARAIVQQSQSRVDAMMMIHRSLTQSMDSLNFTEYAKELVKLIHTSYADQVRDVQVTWEAEEVVLNADQATPLALILNELVSNAFKYAFPANADPQLHIALKSEGEELQLTVKDNGPGLSDADTNGTTSEGLKLVRIFARQLQGKLEMKSEGGTVAVIRVEK